jgi:hypothetical protein
MSYTKLIKGACFAAVAAGTMFVVLQFIRPDDSLANATTATWKIVHVLTMFMTVLAFVGMVGVYLYQVREVGVLGLVGILLYGPGFFIIFAFAFVEAAVLPQLTQNNPQYVKDVMAIVSGAEVTGDIGGVAVANVATAITYVVGGAIFGVALFRARVLWRWASALLVIGALSVVLIRVLPQSLDRMVAIPVGVAWAALGASLWQSASRSTDPTRTAGGAILEETAR